MSVIILILQIVLVITPVLTASSNYYASAGSNLYLECLHDFLTDMVCNLTSDQVVTCSEYHLHVSRGKKEFPCDLTPHNSSSACECLINVESGFVLGELYEVQVSRGGNWLFTKNVHTTKSIKPKKPTKVSVNQTQNESYIITWDTGYSTEHVFSSDLVSELTYYVEGSKIPNINPTPAGQFKYELIGRNLESNSNYIVRVRIKSLLNDRFSDYSDEVKFTTPVSPNQVLKIIITVVCIILIISVLIIYYFCSKIQTKWWDKIPTPKIATTIVKQVPHLLPTQNELLTVHLDSWTLVQTEEKIGPASSPVDLKSENRFNILGKDGNSSEVSYSQTVIQSVEANSYQNNSHGKEFPSTSNQMPVWTQYHKNLKVINCEVGGEHVDSFDFINMLYSPSSEHCVNSKIAFPALKKDLIPKINTDFEYGLWTGSSGSENAVLSPSPTPSGDITVVHGYQSVINLQDSASTHQVFISPVSNDVNLITESICRKNTQNISCESPVILVDNEYKDVQSLLRHSEKQQQTLITDPNLERLWDRNLHLSTGMEIDCSYHRV